jgi:hypothetical protein
MPFTSTELSNAGIAALDFYLKNNPVDQVATERPLLKKLMEVKKTFPGAKQYVVEQIRYTYNSNFQWFNGDAEVTYNHRQTLKQASYPWRGCHDGFALNEDELFQNGISIVEGKGGNNSEAERVQLTNILEEDTEALRLGFEQKFDFELHRDGTQSSDALAGLDYLISLTPTVGTVGGIDRSANTFWQNNVKTGLTSGATTMIDGMEQAWRACARNGGQPDFILAGETFIDGFRDASQASITRFSDPASKGYKLDPSVTNLSFHGIPIIWDPVFLDLDNALAPATPWQKRCYFINTKFMKLRPAAGHDMKTRKPPRVYNRYTYYWGLTWKGALTMGRSNAMAVLTVT